MFETELDLMTGKIKKYWHICKSEDQQVVCQGLESLMLEIFCDDRYKMLDVDFCPFCGYNAKLSFHKYTK
jgi:hypothetical protein